MMKCRLYWIVSKINSNSLKSSTAYKKVALSFSLCDRNISFRDAGKENKLHLHYRRNLYSTNYQIKK
jgi:hypothetical protein